MDQNGNKEDNYMIMDFDTRKLKLKKDELLMSNGKKVSAISKEDLLKELYQLCKDLDQRVKNLEIDNKSLKDDVNEIKILEAGLWKTFY